MKLSFSSAFFSALFALILSVMIAALIGAIELTPNKKKARDLLELSNKQVTLKTRISETSSACKAIQFGSKTTESRSKSIDQQSKTVEHCIQKLEFLLSQLDLLTEAYKSLIEESSLQQKREDILSITLTSAGLVIAVVTLWLSLGASAVEKTKSRAEEILKHTEEISALNIAKSECIGELIRLLESRLGTKIAAKSASIIALNVDWLGSKDLQVSSQAQRFLADYWIRAEKSQFPKAQDYISKLNRIRRSSGLGLIEFFD